LDHLIALLPEGDSQKSIGPFALDELTEKPAKHETAYLVDMARVEALDTMGEAMKAVEILERHVGKVDASFTTSTLRELLRSS